jgi:8-oxo-(d)GTP phosphatase
MTIYAAGALLWREEKGKLLVALIHRSRHQDWSFPKGKVDPGETFPEAAVREIYEETGLKIRLGIPLPTAHYTVPTGEDKEVHYWAARVSDKTLAKSNFKPSEEVAKVDWVTPEKAHELLSYKFDNEVLDALLDLEKKHQLKTNSLIVLRHAKAMTRDEWHKGYIVDDGKRPLLDEGTKQAKKLIPLLAAFGPKRVTSSPWVRCFNTVQPYAKKMNLPIIERSQLSENGNKKGPKRTRNVVKDIIDEGKSAVLCSHRPALPTILSELAHLASKEQAKEIEAAADLKPAEFVVLHLAVNPDKKRKKVVAVERWGLL